MSFWQTLRSVLGLRTPWVAPRPEVTPAGEARLLRLPPGHGLRVDADPAPAGWQLRVVEQPVDGPPHPGFDGLQVACDDATWALLHGLHLHHDGERWLVSAHVDVRARETPNPDGRVYVVDRPLAEGRLFFGARAATPPWLAGQLLDRDDVRSVLIRDDTLTVERAPEADWAPIDLAVAAAVRAHVLAAAPLLRPAPVAVRDDALEDAVRAVLEAEIAPAIHRDGGDVELVGIHEGVVEVRLVGACRTCPASLLTLKGGIERTLKEAFPGVIASVEASEA